jgi:alkyl sulfatase BDS1-like metallo-beta-lactamase superfamily hydrolase
VLVYRKVPADEATADATLTLTSKFRLIQLAEGDVTSPGFEIGGNAEALMKLMGVLEKPDPSFDIITP